MKLLAEPQNKRRVQSMHDVPPWHTSIMMRSLERNSIRALLPIAKWTSESIAQPHDYGQEGCSQDGGSRVAIKATVDILRKW